MQIKSILAFLSDLSQNNNREWFAANKDRYEQTRTQFEELSGKLIAGIAAFDPEIRHLDVKDCIFRIYRDTRFSKDKTPYKTHFGVFIAAGGGRKSIRGGYYLHLDPSGSFVATGVWCPPPDLLKALRQSIFDNIEELRDIINDDVFSGTFNGGFYQEDKLKTAPKGFPAGFPEIDLLKLKHYMVEHKLADKMLNSDDFIDQVCSICKTAHPLNVFLNYTVDEFTAKK
jgi:uncharacterized protein (TIGR02453 family)